jgi:glutaredoxin 3
LTLVPDADVIVYTTQPCAYCRQAKALLEARGIAYLECDLARDMDGREALHRRTGFMTFPQIIVRDHVVGGFRELLQADRSGALASLVADAA